MERFVEIFKRYPLWIVGGVVGVVVLWWLMGSDDSAAAGGVINVGPSAETVNANAAMEIARMQLNAEAAAGQREIELAGILSTTQLAQSGLDNEALAMTLEGNRAITEIQAERDVAISDAGARQAIQIASISANRDITVNKDTIAGGTAQAGIASTTAQQLANIEKDIAFKVADTALAIAKIPKPATPTASNATAIAIAQGGGQLFPIVTKSPIPGSESGATKNTIRMVPATDPRVQGPNPTVVRRVAAGGPVPQGMTSIPFVTNRFN